MRLSPRNLDHLAKGVERPDYHRDSQAAGIVHFGIGAFHRAHQAWYTDLAMSAGDRDWAIIGVSMRSDSVARQLNPQGGLFTVTERDSAGASARMVGAVREVLVAAQARSSLLIRLIAPHTHIVSFTVTEKGYCRGANGGLDPVLADKDSFYPLIAEAMRRRRDAGIAGLTFLSCDNHAENGRQLEKLMAEYLRLRDPDLLDWFHRHCACPSTMVDRIVPSTTDTDRADLAKRIGLEDHGAVMTEPFSQWVVEDRFAGPRPDWQSAGVDLVDDVRPYETAKLRMLNGAHSLLAYCGLRRGHQFVHQAIRDPALRPLVERLMRDEAAPTIEVAPGQNLERYADELIERFANMALNHRLLQIAMDGSQKLPQRWLETLAINQQRGRVCPAILSGVAAWIEHLRGANGPVDDPRAAALSSAARSVDAIDALFGSSGHLASDWRPSPADRNEIQCRLA